MDGRLYRYLWVAMILFFSGSSMGCIGVGAHLLYWMQGNRIDPEYEGLEGKRVAVVVMSDAAPYGPDVSTQILAQTVRRQLATQIKKIDLVSRNEIETWTDTNNWDQIDYMEIGKGVNADLVIAIELAGYNIQQSAALYRGSTRYSVQVYDLKNANDPRIPVFGKGPIEYSFPKDHPIPATSGLSTSKFEQMFMSELGDRISHVFCGYEMPENIARSAATNNH